MRKAGLGQTPLRYKYETHQIGMSMSMVEYLSDMFDYRSGMSMSISGHLLGMSTNMFCHLSGMITSMVDHISSAIRGRV